VAVSDAAVLLWESALEECSYSYTRHITRGIGSGDGNESKVECHAIRHFSEGAELLGASPELANELLPLALAAHARMVALVPEYRDRRCKLPIWSLPMTP
jgi:hypothetical protein